MDLLDFEVQDLYFEHDEGIEVTALLNQAAKDYGQDCAEISLLRAYFLAPESLNVLIALNRFYYYQHRLEDSLTATLKALAIIRQPLNFPENWQALQPQHLLNTPRELRTQLRLYLFCLKSVGFLNMRLHCFSSSQSIFEKLITVDPQDRIGAKALLAILMAQIHSETTADYYANH
jgi:hypothetical protein